MHKTKNSGEHIVGCLKDVFSISIKKTTFLELFPFSVESFCVFLYSMYCMCCTCRSLCFHFHLADSVNPRGNSGAAIKLPAPVCSGWTSITVVHSHQCRHEGFCLLGQESSDHCEICSSLSLTLWLLWCYKNVEVAFVDFFVECFGVVVFFLSLYV